MIFFGKTSVGALNVINPRKIVYLKDAVKIDQAWFDF